VAIACKNNDFGFEPRETAFDSSAKRVAVGKFLEDVKRRNSTKTDVIKDQNIGEFASIEPFSGVVRGFDPFVKSVVFIEPPTFARARWANPYIHFGYVAVDSDAFPSLVLSIRVKP